MHPAEVRDGLGDVGADSYELRSSCLSPQCCYCSSYARTDSLSHSRVAELEQENANLKASMQQRTPPPVDDGLKSELEELRRQLAETQQRERELAEKLSTAPEPVAEKTDVVKTEAVEPTLPVSLRAHKGERSGASFGLMVRTSPFSATPLAS